MKKLYQTIGTITSTECAVSGDTAERKFTLNVIDQNYTFTMSSVFRCLLEDPLFAKINPRVCVVFTIKSNNVFAVIDVATTNLPVAPIKEIEIDEQDLPF